MIDDLQTLTTAFYYNGILKTFGFIIAISIKRFIEKSKPQDKFSQNQI